MRRYRIRLLPWVFGEKATTWVRVHQSQKRDLSLKGFSEPGTGDSTTLAAWVNALVPATDDFAVEGQHGRATAGNGVVVVVTTHDPLEPGADLIEG